MTLPALRAAVIWTGVGVGHVAALGFLWGRSDVGRAEGQGVLVLSLLAPVAPPALLAAAPAPMPRPREGAGVADLAPRSTDVSRPVPVEAPLAAAAPAPSASPALEPARFLSRVEPDYPREARLTGAEGLARVRLRLAADGAVLDAAVVVSSGSRLLDDAALEAARTSRYAPARVGGLPTASETEAAYRFELR